MARRLQFGGRMQPPGRSRALPIPAGPDFPIPDPVGKTARSQPERFRLRAVPRRLLSGPHATTIRREAAGCRETEHFNQMPGTAR